MKIMVQEEMAELLEGKTTNGWIPELVEETKAMEQALAVRAQGEGTGRTGSVAGQDGAAGRGEEGA